MLLASVVALRTLEPVKPSLPNGTDDHEEHDRYHAIFMDAEAAARFTLGFGIHHEG